MMGSTPKSPAPWGMTPGGRHLSDKQAKAIKPSDFPSLIVTGTAWGYMTCEGLPLTPLHQIYGGAAQAGPNGTPYDFPSHF
jgi:hypothetical protein